MNSRFRQANRNQGRYEPDNAARFTQAELVAHVADEIQKLSNQHERELDTIEYMTERLADGKLRYDAFGDYRPGLVLKVVADYPELFKLDGEYVKRRF